ncbi:MAG TPA: hypothetical protein VN882_10895 [Steroidobacteraceae bacterium]|nr:hypothetical protein [Steroidobacteraceae bacterium]
MISTPTDARTGPAPATGAMELGLSMGSIAAIAAAALVYISGTFLIAEALGIKRPLQAALAVPIVLMGSYYVATRPRQLLNPLLGFVVLKTVAEITLRGTAVDLFDDVATLFGLAAILGASARASARSVRVITVLAGVLAAMAILQWIVLFFQPDLQDELLAIDDEGKVVGGVHHVVALLGLATGEQYTLLGHSVTRLQSFAKEPSLNLVYFLIPSAIAFLRGGTLGMSLGVFMLGFSVLSLSGSVFLSLGFSGAAWLALRVFSVKKVLLWGSLSIFGAYMAALVSGQLKTVLALLETLSQYGDFMSKKMSFTQRAGGAAESLGSFASSPFGAPALPDIPGPWLINGVVMAGWLGGIMLVLFVRQLAIQLDRLDANRGRQLNVRIGILLLIGALTTVIVFNDYQMGNYAGLVLLGILYRMLEAQNQADRDVALFLAAPRPPPGSHAGEATAAHV